MARSQRDFTVDVNLQLSDGGLVTADAVTQVDSTDVIIDLGAARVDARLILDAAVVEVATGDEVCGYFLEFSNSASFASGIRQGPGIFLGDQAPAPMGNADTDNGAGRYELGFTNEFPGGTIYRYVRLNQNFSGTIDTGFNVTAWIVLQ
jgi:hypothetical protein